MIRRTASLALKQGQSDTIKVGILGSGITGCTVASTLLQSSSDKKFDITVYEAGRGVGGRMSTRSSFDNDSDEQIYQFDYGCRAIFPPKTELFRSELERWRKLGWVKQWNGKFVTIRCGDESSKNYNNNNQIIAEDTAEDEERYVGYPRMNSICEQLLQTKSNKSTVAVITQTRAAAFYVQSAGSRMWQLRHHDNAESKVLGEYDWLVCTDRNSASTKNVDLRDANIRPFNQLVNENIQSIPICTTMVILDKPLPITVDAIQIDHANNPTSMTSKFGTLEWITRDSSKPGRKQYNSDNSKTNECWVLQSSEQEGKRLLESKRLQGASLEQIRDVIRETMVADFKNSLPLLMSSSNACSDDSVRDIPLVVQSFGHRWGAAFPKHIAENNTFKSIDCYLDADKQFIACGDYFGKCHGSVEGAFLSGRAAAYHLIEKE
ncbi:hypothetical protein HJC23_009629 [Cyclotella cryptica]|uniref:Amine oxidase domain-containing protein n=1 Tax=Cyclotella cryptica TaxID=29204 RepID=A0ABD3Q1K2_9STRA